MYKAKTKKFISYMALCVLIFSLYAMNKLSKGTLTDEEKNIGNVNYDNIFDVADIIKIMRYLSGKVASLS